MKVAFCKHHACAGPTRVAERIVRYHQRRDSAKQSMGRGTGLGAVESCAAVTGH